MSNSIIKNRESLISQGDVKSRQIVLDIAEEALHQLHAGRRIRSILSRQGSILRIGERQWDLSQKRNIYLIGAGKACNAMAAAVEDVLGDYLTDGILIVKILEDTDIFHKVRVYVGGHPVPNEEGMRASIEIQKLIDNSCDQDLFLCVMSGGSSSLMCLPVKGISLEDEIRTSDVLLKCGANIREINAVRRHISQMNGGRMAERIAQKGAELIGFNISDSVSYGPTGDISIPWKDFTATPMGPDQTTIEDALHTIDKYGFRDRLPTQVTHYLESCGPKGETPKSFPQNTYYQINTLPDSCRYAEEAVKKLGLPVAVLSTFLEGEAADAGRFMAAIARQIQTYGQPFPAPCVILSAGEVVTTIRDNRSIHGHGGPSQEMVLGFAEMSHQIPGACFLSIDSEGTDGTTLAAGGIVDSTTGPALNEKQMDIRQTLSHHASHEALCAVNSAVFTGNTGTNVCDLNILFVPEKQR